MANNITCARCGLDKAPLAKQPPLPGEDAALVLARVCVDCWGEWREEEVRTINELRLNFMDPDAQRTLRERMLSYLGLSASEDDETPLCERD